MLYILRGKGNLSCFAKRNNYNTLIEIFFIKFFALNFI